MTYATVIIYIIPLYPPACIYLIILSASILIHNKSYLLYYILSIIRPVTHKYNSYQASCSGFAEIIQTENISFKSCLRGSKSAFLLVGSNRTRAVTICARIIGPHFRPISVRLTRLVRLQSANQEACNRSGAETCTGSVR